MTSKGKDKYKTIKAHFENQTGVIYQPLPQQQVQGHKENKIKIKKDMN